MRDHETCGLGRLRIISRGRVSQCVHCVVVRMALRVVDVAQRALALVRVR